MSSCAQGTVPLHLVGNQNLINNNTKVFFKSMNCNSNEKVKSIKNSDYTSNIRYQKNLWEFECGIVYFSFISTQLFGIKTLYVSIYLYLCLSVHLYLFESKDQL